MTNLCAMAQNEIFSGINVAQNDDNDDECRTKYRAFKKLFYTNQITLKTFNDDVELLMVD